MREPSKTLGEAWVRLTEVVNHTNATSRKNVIPIMEYSSYEDIGHMIIGVSTEAGELLDAWKKSRYQGRDIDYVNLEEECGDILYYMCGLLGAINSNPRKVIDAVCQKLGSRYPDGWDPKRSADRDLQKEREILEGSE